MIGDVIDKLVLKFQHTRLLVGVAQTTGATSGDAAKK
jgi:hypothetical protein